MPIGTKGDSKECKVKSGLLKAHKLETQEQVRRLSYVHGYPNPAHSRGQRYRLQTARDLTLHSLLSDYVRRVITSGLPVYRAEVVLPPGAA